MTKAPAASTAPSRWLSADECAAMLGVTKATLYAYVSRGKLAASPGPTQATRQYRRSEVERLLGQRGRARRPREVARSALAWGLPVLESTLTLIENQNLYYRGQPAVAVAARASLEEAACLLWQFEEPDAFGGEPPVSPSSWARQCASLRNLGQADRMLAAFAWLQARQGRGGGLANRAGVAAHVVAAQAGALLRLSSAAALGCAPSKALVHRQFAGAWALSGSAADAVRSALVLCADHELNASSFVARCVASTGADLGKSIVAGLAALSGGLHGGATARVEAMWDELARARSLRAGLEQRVARGERVAGFGHPLYPDADPRAVEILARLPKGAVATFGRRVAAQVDAVTGQRPTLDFALVALRRAIAAPEGGAYAIFAVGRTVGWLAHALEQRERAELIRPRAAYVGERPSAEPSRPAQAIGPASIFTAARRTAGPNARSPSHV